MTINGWDISEAGAVQWNVTPAFLDVSNDSDWDSSAAIPSLFKNNFDFAEFKIAVLIKADGGRDAILKRCSTVLSHLIEPAEIVLDDFSYNIYGVLKKYSHDETAINHFHKLTLTIEGYKYGDAVTASMGSSDTTLTIENEGNIDTPCVVTISPQIGQSSLVISGICKDRLGDDLAVTISNVTTGAEIVLNGENGLFTVNGAVSKNIVIWTLPTLKPGTNTLTFSNKNNIVTVTYKPRYM